ncbi:MAG: AraC family transcriptional regulator [Tistrella sp.]|uniref:AraC family transcriptional regulator n=1 Tax=Tistrella mobilis TaxID=171437 RepID=A0A3B9IKG9_9PROT|nr:AraC family transcriptional regulator [Tistrella sp.]MAD36332.1 AraC family transcriptional regulator [Tistrella sp.]MBA77767.1 AraC family transcriptional regulator [Tistrella sp.]HAE48305.1 AraC family transcriptional regulator [Tistrella mobilis]
MDPLSDILSLLRPKSYVSAGFDTGGDWAVRFDDQQGYIKCYAITRGGCWLVVDGLPGPLWLDTGESFVMPSGRSFILASDPALPPVSSREIFPVQRDQGVVRLGGGGGMFLVGSRFAVDAGRARLLLASLPPVLHVHAPADREALRWAVERMIDELHAPRPGSQLIARHLAHMMLVQALRLCMTEAGPTRTGWFFALADPQMAAAIGAMHADPARRWTVQDLAAAAGMSRSAFAARFRETAGETPMEYLTRWRMLLAADRLETTGDPVSVIAPDLGYWSDSAFSTAFKRVMGRPPRAWSGWAQGADRGGRPFG